MNGPRDTAEILAIEVGTSRIKLGKFAATGNCASVKPASILPIAAPVLPPPLEAISIAHSRDLSGAAASELTRWLTEQFIAEPQCCYASVQPTVAIKLVQFFEERRWSPPRQLNWHDIPLEIQVDEPARAGIDRLLDAVAVNRLREPERPAIVVDLGTAATVNLITASGAFEGGAILPGMTLAAHALHSGTSSLPSLDPRSLSESVAAVGKNTEAAIASGVYWGLVAAINGLVERIANKLPQSPQLFVTGGAAPQVAHHLSVGGEPARHVPYMVLSAIRLVAEQLR